MKAFATAGNSQGSASWRGPPALGVLPPSQDTASRRGTAPSPLLQDLQHSSYFQPNGNVGNVCCSSFPPGDIQPDLIKDFRFLQKSGKSFDFRWRLHSALQKLPEARNSKEPGYGLEIGGGRDRERARLIEIPMKYFAVCVSSKRILTSVNTKQNHRNNRSPFHEQGVSFPTLGCGRSGLRYGAFLLVGPVWKEFELCCRR